MKETNVEVEGIKLAVSMFRKTDPKRCREVPVSYTHLTLPTICSV